MRSPIQLLSPVVAERIAAGEVIERPASVVKELVENALDAGATEIHVRLEKGGKELIEVLDNGNGMSPQDLELCIQRHATSKLRALEDLEKISTLGFRGEALPSIAAVSELSLISRTADMDSAYQLKVSEVSGRFQGSTPQKHTFGHFIHLPHGTCIRAQGLFSQIPARLKFLKSQSAEVTAVRDWMERLAIAFPAVGFQLLSDQRTVLKVKAETEQNRVRAILSGGEDFPVISVEQESQPLDSFRFHIRLHWIQGFSSPRSKGLIQVVNKRALKDRLLQSAVLSSFRQALLPGQFPAVALILEIDPGAVDVNVHPTKSEIRFLETSQIFQVISKLVKSMITQKGAPILVPTTRLSSQPEPFQWTPLVPLSFASTHGNTSHNWKANDSQSLQKGQETIRSPALFHPPLSTPVHSETGSQTNSLSSSNTEPGWVPPWAETRETPPQKAELLLNQQTHFHSILPLLNSARFVGTLFFTYLIFERQKELIFIDQHAAHERIRYEKLRKRVLGTLTETDSPGSQVLLMPETIQFPIESFTLMEERLPWFVRLGFDVELFGENSLLFRSTPVEWGHQAIKSRLKNLINRILSFNAPINSQLLWDESLFEAIASEACHSAIRAGDLLDKEEVQTLAQQLFECEHPWNCPHGRPTVVQVPQGKLEEWFQRKVSRLSTPLEF